MPKVYTDSEVSKMMSSLPDWSFENGELILNREFADFAGSLKFVNQVGEMAEQHDHHPDIDIRYNKVRLALVSHDADGITDNDFHMAEHISELV